MLDFEKYLYEDEYDDELIHYGTKRHSGRYPWGSGEDPYQRASGFMGFVNDLRKQGLSEKERAQACGMTTTELRKAISAAKNEVRSGDMYRAMKLRDKGTSVTEIGRIMGINESSVRSLLDTQSKIRTEKTNYVADVLKKAVDERGYIDISAGVELQLGVSRTKLNAAVAKLEEDGYVTTDVQVNQLTTNNKTRIKVLCPEGTTYGEVARNTDKISSVLEYAGDSDDRPTYVLPPVAMKRDRILVRYNEEGGLDKDGLVELRPGVADLAIGQSKYAQVRIAVEGNQYMKGLAVYNPDIPDGYDVVYNTNKHLGAPDSKVFKKMKDDPDNPFGAMIKPLSANGQRMYTDADGTKKQSVVNIINEEGDWGEWSKTISSQVLSKQLPSLAKKQLALAYDKRKAEYDDIMSVTNPVLREKLLISFADGCDSAAVKLKAAGLPRQCTHVIVPMPSLKSGEVYAPNYRDGERVVLIRFPHGGKFEIPELVVNNKNAEAKKILGNAKDAIGIRQEAAEQLSGADFDGDFVLVIPNNNGAIKTMKPLKQLENFDTKECYPAYEGMPVVGPATGFHKGAEMGKVSNLLTDMTIKGAPPEHIAMAVKHSMVVIDAEKHNLNWKQSAIDNQIDMLKELYQGGKNRGASTLISKATSEERVDVRKAGVLVEDPVTGAKRRQMYDPKTGAKLYTYTPEEYTNKDGKIVKRTIKSTKMYETNDAHTLSSGTKMEEIYADHANSLKALGNKARLMSMKVGTFQVDKEAAVKYKEEVKSLDNKLKVALSNAPLERQALIAANAAYKFKTEGKEMTKEEKKKVKTVEMARARARFGASKSDKMIEITEKEWEAIQSHAVSKSKLQSILDNTDLDKVKSYATPREDKGMTDAQIARITTLTNAGATTAEIAEALGVSTSTITKYR